MKTPYMAPSWLPTLVCVPHALEYIGRTNWVTKGGKEVIKLRIMEPGIWEELGEGSSNMIKIH